MESKRNQNFIVLTLGTVVSIKKNHSSQQRKKSQKTFIFVEIQAADRAVLSAMTDAEKKKANQIRSQISRYGTSCFLQLLDDDPPPAENRL